MPRALAEILLAPCAALLLAPAAREQPKAEARQGQKLERTIVFEDKSVLASVVMRAGDEEREVPGASGLESSSEGRIVLEDEIVAAEDGHATRLKRRFRELESTSVTTMHSGGEKKSLEGRRESPFAGREVEFAREGDGEDWTAKWIGAGADDALLEHLEPEIDFASWLPAREVREGDTWKISAEVYARTVLRPAGNLHFDSDPPQPAEHKELQEALFHAFEGELELTWQGVREVDGRELGVIGVEGEVASEGAIDVGGERSLRKIAIEIEEEIEGELLWDLSASRAHALELARSGRQTRTESGRGRVGEREVDVARVMRLDTDQTSKISFEEP